MGIGTGVPGKGHGSGKGRNIFNLLVYLCFRVVMQFVFGTRGGWGSELGCRGRAMGAGWVGTFLTSLLSFACVPWCGSWGMLESEYWRDREWRNGEWQEHLGCGEGLDWQDIRFVSKQHLGILVGRGCLML